MFFKKKLELLQKQNIKTGCKSMTKEEAIKTIGTMLYDGGYIEAPYIEGMMKREEVFATNIGNGIAIPHSVEEYKKYVKHSGIAVMVFPEGTPWNEDEVKLVVGIAGKGEEHLDILANIAERLSTPDAVEVLAAGGVEKVYQTFVGKE